MIGFIKAIIKSQAKPEAKVDWKIDLAVVGIALAVLVIGSVALALLAPQLPQAYQDVPVIYP